jgi:hypothetical protein
LNSHYDDPENKRYEQTGEKTIKVLYVPFAYTFACPRTVVVVFLYANPTFFAMFGTRAPVNLANAAKVVGGLRIDF